MGAGGRKVAPCRPTRCRSACRSSLANRRLNGRLSRCDEDHRFVSIVHGGRAKRRIASRRAVLGAARGRSPSMTLAATAPRRPDVADSRVSGRHISITVSARKPSARRLHVPKKASSDRGILHLAPVIPNALMSRTLAAYCQTVFAQSRRRLSADSGEKAILLASWRASRSSTFAGKKAARFNLS
jgi:hypothetical protein